MYSHNKYSWGSRSVAQRDTCHPDMVKILDLFIRRTYADVGLHQGGRTVDEQQEYFDNGSSSINPRDYKTTEDLARVAKHIIIPNHPEFGLSRAIDMHIAEKYNGKSLAWDTIHLAYVSGVMTSCAQELYDKGEIEHIIRPGNDWDMDGIIGLDHTLRDFPHFELIKPK